MTTINITIDLEDNLVKLIKVLSEYLKESKIDLTFKSLIEEVTEKIIESEKYHDQQGAIHSIYELLRKDKPDLLPKFSDILEYYKVDF